MLREILSYSLVWSVVFLGSASANDSWMLPEYQAVDDKDLIHGVLSSSGSTTLSPILKEWLRSFTLIYPSVTFTMEAEGSGSAPSALLSGKANLGAMSRKIKEKEVRPFKTLKSYKPYELKVAVDALGVIVNLQNPISSISIPQLDAVYSESRLCGYPKSITEWRYLGWNIPNQIEVLHIDENSGSHGFLKKIGLCHGRYREYDNVSPTHHTSLDMVKAIKSSRLSLGFASITAIDRSVKKLKVSRSKKYPSILPNSSSIANGLYPLTRYLYLYLDKHPESELEPHIAEFIKYIYSRQGQKIALVQGAFPLSIVDLSKQLNIFNKPHSH